MARSLQASSIALAEKMDAMRAENEALHIEVADLTDEMAKQQARLEAEARRLRGSVCELEQQLQSVAIGYEQIERQSQGLSRQNAELRASLSVATAGKAAHPDSGVNGAQTALEKEVVAARVQIEELQR